MDSSEARFKERGLGGDLWVDCGVHPGTQRVPDHNEPLVIAIAVNTTFPFISLFIGQFRLGSHRKYTHPSFWLRKGTNGGDQCLDCGVFPGTPHVPDQNKPLVNTIDT